MLTYNIIPRYPATLRHIRAALEEDECNTLFQIKVLRAAPADLSLIRPVPVEPCSSFLIRNPDESRVLC